MQIFCSLNYLLIIICLMGMKSKSESFGGYLQNSSQNKKSSLDTHLSIQTLLIDTYQHVFNLQVCLIKELSVNKDLLEQSIIKDKLIAINTRTKAIEVEIVKISPPFIYKNRQASQNPSSLKIENNHISEPGSVFKPRKVLKIRKKLSSGSCYNPSSQNSEKNKQKAVRQTKHIPKNYGKAIINFMLKHPKIVEDLCLKQGKNIHQLWKVVQSYKGKIYTVANLRSMWLQEDNPFAKIFRTISMHYLRKHCLQHIYNSRVENHNRHIKYRYKIIQAVKDPQSFTRIKEY